MYYKFKSFTPYIHPSAFVHPLAAITGCVRVGKNVYIGPFAAVSYTHLDVYKRQ